MLKKCKNESHICDVNSDRIRKPVSAVIYDNVDFNFYTYNLQKITIKLNHQLIVSRNLLENILHPQLNNNFKLAENFKTAYLKIINQL